MSPYVWCGVLSQALQVSSNYRELEKKYGALTSMMSSQNQFIARLEKQCQCSATHSTHLSSVVQNKSWFECCMFFGFNTGTENGVLVLFCEQVTSEPPKSSSNVHPNYSSEAKEITNDVQRDQSAPPPKQGKAGGVPSLPTTTDNTPTGPPFISFPVTKTPGTPMSNTSFSRSTR